jgi:proteic killer suppression protein
MAIQSFSDKDTEEFFVSGHLKKGTGWINVSRIAKRKLDMIHYAAIVEDLRAPPGNKLKALRGDFEGYYSIRINDQWRIIFRWSNSGPYDVKITDYH